MTAAPQRVNPWPGFVELPENRLVFQAVRRLARSLARGTVPPFPLLVLHGPTGTGKTLLCELLVKRIIRGTAVRTARSLPANELRFSTDHDVDIKDLIAVDLLVVEDLQQLPASAVTTLTRVLDERQRRRHATVLTANDSPARLRKLPTRLLGRLAGGLTLALTPLAVPSKKSILTLYCEEKRLPLADDALNWLASRPTGGSVRSLLGTLDVLNAEHRGHVEPVTLDAVKTLFADETARPVEAIVKRVAEAYGVKTKELLGPSRLRNVLLPRQVAMYLARDVGLLSLPRIGAHFGGRDHSTVLHAVNKIRTAMVDDRQLAGTIRQLKHELA